MRGMEIVLRVTAGPHAGSEYRFDGHDSFLVGRASFAHFRLPQKDPFFSRLHFLIEINPPRCKLVDMGSTNGTNVNGKKVDSVELRDGDRIEGGKTTLQVVISNEDDRESESSRAASVSERLAQPAAIPAPQVLPPIPPPPPPRQRAAAAVPSTRPPSAVPHPTPHFSSLPQEAGLPLIPGYRLLGEIGQGGMGVVYQAVCEPQPAHEMAAIKTIRPAGASSPCLVQRFLRETEILRQLRHPNIVGFRDGGQTGELLYFVMDFVPGIDAGRLVQREGPLAIERAVRLVAQALEALQFAHERGFVHRDVKPSNLLVASASRTGLQPVFLQRPQEILGESRDGLEPSYKPVSPNDELCLLADFGLARVYQQSQLSGLTMLGETGGTVAFMPPEQVTNFRNAEPPADQYSAAATLYYLLTGQTPHELAGLKNHQALKKILLDDPTPIRAHRADIPRPLANAVHRALSRDPSRRFPDAASFAQAIL